MGQNQPIALEWIWPAVKKQVNQYVQFHHAFPLDAVDLDARLRISCEGNFTAYINGEFVVTGQFGDYPDRPTFSEVRVGEFLQEGKNVLSVVGYHFGIEHFSHISSDPALAYCLCCGTEVVASGRETRWRLHGGYRSGEMAQITTQMGFVFEYDAQKIDGWIESDYVCSPDWKRIARSDFVNRAVAIERPLPILELKAPTSMRIIAQGKFVRDGSAKDKTFAELMQSDFLSFSLTADIFQESTSQSVEIKGEVLKENGAYLIIDMGREECGFLTLDVEGPQGTVIDIAVGEHLEDLRVRASVGGRNFASRYICGESRQHFTHYNNRYAGRFLELHISPSRGPIKINYAGIIPVEYPVSVEGGFNSLDSLMNRIYDVSCRTLHLCMHEHYEDCPWREQGLYANDARIQALVGYYAFGEYDFPRVSFDLLGRSHREDNYLTLTAPSRAVDFTIPSFTMLWFVAMDDLLLFSGNREFSESYLPQIQTMLDSYIASCTEGLLPCPKGKAYWHFYDWADGLEGVEGGEWETVESLRFDAPLNLFFVMALQSVARMCRSLGRNDLGEKYREQAEVTCRAIDRKFWVESEQAYQTYLGGQGVDNHFCELVQAQAILTGTAGKGRSGILRRKLTDEGNGWVAATLSQSFYKYEALCGDSDNYASWVFADIEKTWSKMLSNGATSFWETIKGHADFDHAGSLCHGWSASPAYFYQTYLLGIKPLDNGFKRFSVAPVVNRIDQAEGTVMTPVGAIKVRRKNSETKTEVEVSYPEELEPIVDLDDPRVEWVFNPTDRF